MRGVCVWGGVLKFKDSLDCTQGGAQSLKHQQEALCQVCVVALCCTPLSPNLQEVADACGTHFKKAHQALTSK